MSAQVNNYNFTTIGRMFARQNVPAVYGQQKAATAEKEEVAVDAVDSVSLSPFAPKPYSARLFEDAMDAGRALGANAELSADTTERLREDRIFAAMSALAFLGEEGEFGARSGWPGGIPVPTREEMEVARRRLAQRLSNVTEVEDSVAVQQDRLDLMRKIGKRDFAELRFMESGQISSAAAAS